MKPGTATLYRADMNERAYKLCLLGLTDKQLSIAFGINQQTLDNWKNAHPSFYMAISEGKKEADAHVADALYNRAIGYSHKDMHITNFRGEITETPITKYYPPDTKACIFWLKNRQREYWRDMINTELTGAGGGPLQIEGQIDLSDFSDEELERMESVGLKLRESATKGDNGRSHG